MSHLKKKKPVEFYTSKKIEKNKSRKNLILTKKNLEHGQEEINTVGS